MIELLGWIATAGTILSFTMNSMSKLRLVGGIFAILWIVYGILKMDNPIIVINSFIVVIHLHWFYKNRNGAGAGGKVEKGNFIDSAPTPIEQSNSVGVDKSPNSLDKDSDFMYNWIREKSGK